MGRSIRAEGSKDGQTIIVPVQNVDEDGNIGTPLLGTSGNKINPATEEKQNNIITELQSLVTSNAIPTDMEGGGKIAVGTARIPVTFIGTTKSIIISAEVTNTGQLYVGKDDVESDGSSAIVFLEAGENIVIEYEDGTNDVYVVASIAAQNFWKGALF